jgi:hypothetical protein
LLLLLCRCSRRFGCQCAFSNISGPL